MQVQVDRDIRCSSLEFAKKTQQRGFEMCNSWIPVILKYVTDVPEDRKVARCPIYPAAENFCKRRETLESSTELTLDEEEKKREQRQREDRQSRKRLQRFRMYACTWGKNVSFPPPFLSSRLFPSYDDFRPLWRV